MMLRNLFAAMMLIGITGMTAVYAQKATIHESPHKELKRSCEKCHVATSFKKIRFDHDETRFPLNGPHQNAKCLACHNVENFTKVESACGVCHDDVHAGQMGTDCERCHLDDNWKSLDAEAIHAETDFPLMGRHLMTDCEMCHTGMSVTSFRRAPTECIDCHRADFEGATPSHNGFSDNCQECHAVGGWEPATLRDHEPLFPIQSGIHAGTWNDCAECHPSGPERGFTCLSCHEHAQPAMDPIHVGMGSYSYVSQLCLNCHPTGRADRYGEHDTQFFPIFTGTHNNTWDDCVQCHETPTNKALFTCISCHDHNQTDMNNVHNGLAGYSYVSSECLGCHPDGTAGSFTQHDTQYFPIFSGSHNNTWNNCVECHPTPSNKAQFTCVSCHEHSQTTMAGVHGGMSGYSYASQECLSCHPDGLKGRFTAHDSQFFPIYSGRHSGTWSNDCSRCHDVAQDRSQFTCISCHEHSQTRMDAVHQGEARDYRYTRTSCFECHPSGRAGN